MALFSPLRAPPLHTSQTYSIGFKENFLPTPTNNFFFQFYPFYHLTHPGLLLRRRYIKSHLLLRQIHLLHFSQRQQPSPPYSHLSQHRIYRRVISINLVINGGENLKVWVDNEVGSQTLEVRLSKFNKPKSENSIVSHNIDLFKI
jgi:hypothetical protein